EARAGPAPPLGGTASGAFQTEARAEPAPPLGGTASGAFQTEARAEPAPPLGGTASGAFQTEARAEPAPPLGGTASGALVSRPGSGTFPAQAAASAACRGGRSRGAIHRAFVHRRDSGDRHPRHSARAAIRRSCHNRG